MTRARSRSSAVIVPHLFSARLSCADKLSRVTCGALKCPAPALPATHLGENPRHPHELLVRQPCLQELERRF